MAAGNGWCIGTNHECPNVCMTRRSQGWCVLVESKIGDSFSSLTDISNIKRTYPNQGNVLRLAFGLCIRSAMLHASPYHAKPFTAAKLMPHEQKMVEIVLVVVVQNVENVIAIRPVDLHRVSLIGEWLRVVTTLQSPIISRLQ
jgi:hypothetical protein